MRVCVCVCVHVCSIENHTKKVYIYPNSQPNNFFAPAQFLICVRLGVEIATLMVAHTQMANGQGYTCRLGDTDRSPRYRL